ncbi:M20 metallopeptidase family protein [Nocardia aurantia]|uniref:Hippurate hydrolase n=1 Tax=Nocardia aurantia TaxID=2585199 RepID=A0A7K0DQC0_9NOCA|nr:M20 family metallopeptidase [Nocardia aurantia]MQY27562.1 Hippurate hydrolase [Nocardia aurantia]
MSGQAGLLDDARARQSELVRLRRALHAEPEVGLHLPRTQEKVLRALDGLGLEVRTGSALTSVVAVVRGTGSAAPVLLRADLDALPMTERTGLDYASRIPGAAHACGHDLHTAILVGTAGLLAARRDRLAGDVILMFQPGEEGHDGAALMLAEGLLEVAGARPAAAYALHVGAAAPAGVFGHRAGPVLAASGTLAVTFHGAGGHGAAPHLARDPIPALGAAIGALQSLVTRRFDAQDPVVLSIGAVHAGTAANIVPETATLTATTRAFSAATHARLTAAAAEVCHGIAAAHGVTATVEAIDGYPVTVNDPERTAAATDVLAELFGPDRVRPTPQPGLFSDDIGRVLAEVPGAMLTLGACPPGTDPVHAPGNHSPRAVFDDSVLADGVSALTGLALRATGSA